MLIIAWFTLLLLAASLGYVYPIWLWWLIVPFALVDLAQSI